MASKRKQGYQKYSTMSAQTKKFLQKICYKETASVDMTKYGFVNQNIRVFVQPLRSQLEKIHGQENNINHTKVPKKLKWSEKDPNDQTDLKHSKKNVKNKVQHHKTNNNQKKSN